MQWDLERTGDIGVLRPSGLLGASVPRLFPDSDAAPATLTPQ